MEWIKRIRAAIGPELTFVTSAGAWISDDEGRVLLQRRSAADPLWGFPGGIMEIGEAAHETAVREVQEETGLEVEPVSLIGVYTKYFETIAKRGPMPVRLLHVRNADRRWRASARHRGEFRAQLLSA
jgi:8-oxo-dGTP pyrophosphatase MutT (NUDIX family)